MRINLLKKRPSSGTTRGIKGRGQNYRRPPHPLGIEALECRALLAALALDDSYRLIQGQPLEVTASGVTANDVQASGNAVSVLSNTAPANGTLTLAANGTFTYTPNPGYVGPDTFNYTISDGLSNTDTATVSLDIVAASTAVADVVAGPRLASINSTQGALLNGLLGGLLGTSLSVNVLDWNALAGGDVSADGLLGALQTDLGVATPGEALNADITLGQLLDAAATAAAAEGDTALVSAFNNLGLQIAGLTGTIRLADVLQVDPNDGSLADARLDALDLVTGGVQLFNFENVAATTTPVTISGAALGLGSLLNSIELSAIVVEPPVHVIGGPGTGFRTAATRLRLDLDLVDLSLDTSTLGAALLGPLQAILGPLISVNTNAQIGQLSLYVDVASGTGTIQTIDAIGSAVNLQATPGVANLYLGEVPDSAFTNRSLPIDPASILPANAGSLGVAVNLLATPLINATAGIALSSVALGVAPGPQTSLFDGPFPETQTFGSSATFVSNLISTLIANLEVDLTGTLGGTLDGLADTVIVPALRTIVGGAVTPVLSSVLASVADPALDLLGVGIGELVVTVDPIVLAADPAANADFVGTLEDAPIAILVLGNDAGVPPNSTTVVSVTQPTNGTTAINPDGTITYTPNANYFGPDTFTYTITDGNGGTSTATVTVLVASVNDPPVAAPDSYAAAEDTPLTVAGPGVLANDTDVDGNPLTAVVVTNPTNGTLTLNPDGSFTYVPAQDFNGTDTFTYQASDGTALSAPVTVTIAVGSANDAPVANADAYVATEDAPLVIAGPGVLGNDTDADGNPITAVLVTSTTNGTLTLNPDGSFTYVPAANFAGTDTFTYRASDGVATSGIATVTIAVGAVNDAPVAAPDSYTATEDTPLTVAGPGVLANDTDVDGNPLTALVVTNPTNGTLTLNPDGSFTYVPALNFVGTDTFTYQASDGTATSAITTVTVAVGAVNDAPAANPDAYAATEDATLTVAGPGVLANDSDPDGSPLTAVVVTSTTNGVLTLNPDGSFTYVPAANFVGTDTFTYRASDGVATSGIATVTITVGGLDDAPVAVPDTYTATEDTSLTVAGPGVLGNDTDADGDPLTAVLVAGPTNGTLTLNPDGSFTYVPDANFNGPDSFTYQASDGTAFSAPVTVTIAVGAVNDAPAANPDAYSVAEDTTLTTAGPGVLDNDSDPDGDPLTATVVTSTTNGTLTLNPDGSFTYVPALNFVGTDTFTYQASDGTATSAVTTVTITVGVDNDAPVASPDSYIATEDTPLTVAGPGVLGNDTDADGDPLTAVLVAGPTNGTLTLNPDGSFTYVPDTNFNGPDFFTYQASDGVAFSAPVTVTVAVGALNDAPAANPDAYAATEDTTLTVALPGVLANDTDVEGSPLTATVVTSTTNGTLTLNPDGSFTYVPAANFVGTDTFTYQASDGVATSGIATVTITVGALDDAPVAVPDSYTATEDTSLTVAGPGVLGNDTDADGDPLTAVLVAGPTNGTLTLNPDGSFTYVPDANFNGPDSFTYQASDGTALSAPVTVTIAVGAVNDAPAANPDAYAATEDTTLTVALPGVLANDTDVEGSPLTATVVTSTTNGTLTLNPDGSFTYVPAANFVGTDTFTYQASDGVATSAIATVTITVGGANDSPVASPDSYVATEDTALTVAGPGVLGNDTDADGDPLTAVLVAGPTNGTLTLNPDGSFTYVPGANFNGPDSFTYQASDGTAFSAPVTVTIAVGAVNDAPAANPDPYAATEDTTLTVALPGVLANDTDAEGNALTAVLVTSTTNGTLTLNPDGSFTYVPAANFVGTDTFTYRASDGVATSGIATVTITVGAIEETPVAVPDAYTATEDTPLSVAGPGVLANDTDADGDPLTAVLVAGPTNGTLTLNPDGSFLYVPGANFNGSDTFSYQASDGTAFSSPVTVTIAVGAVNDAPAVNPDAYSVAEDTTLTVTLPGVLANDSDAEGSPLTATLVTSTSNGTLTFNADGSFTYVPNANFVGTDTFTYQASDGTATSAIATVTITVGVANDAPVASPDTYAATEDTPLTVAGPGVLGNDTDVDGDTLTAVIVTNPTNGTLTLNPDGSFTYVPNANFNGSDSYSYQASDGTALSAPVTVTIAVGAVNDAPTANPDAYPATEDTPLTVPGPGVLANDTDAEGNPLTAVLVSGPTSGSLTLNPDGSFTYVPAPNFNGTATFTYRASDGTALSAPVTVTIAVGAVNDAPSAGDDVYPNGPGGTLVIPGPGVLGNDTDVDGNPLTPVVVTPPTNGTLTLNPDGSFTYIPGPGFVGTDMFTYRAFDGVSFSNLASVSVVTAAAPLPQATGLARYGYHSQPTQLVVSFNTDLAPARAQDVRNFVLVSPGRDGRFGTRDDRRIVLRSAVYDPVARTVTLNPRNLLALRARYRLTMVDGGLTSASGVALDGDRNGQAGGAGVIDFDRSALAGPSVVRRRVPLRQAKVAAAPGLGARMNAAAVDAVLASQSVLRMGARRQRTS